MKTLQSPYLKVDTKNGTAYGGNQAWLPYKFLKGMGCGLISAADVIFHLEGKENVTEAEYVAFAKKLWKWYLPVIPGFGMNGLTLMMGLNRYFKAHGLSHRAYWKISGRKLFSRIDQMLSDDIPVILSVGPNFPLIWKKEKLNFYNKSQEGEYFPATKIKAHFVTVTGRDGAWLQISSWGKEYYISIREYREYVKRHSSFLVSNVIDIQ